MGQAQIKTFSHRLSEAVEGVVPLVGKQVAGLEVRVQLQQGSQVRPQFGPFSAVTWSVRPRHGS